MTKATKPKTTKQIEKNQAKTLLNQQIADCIKMFETVNPAMSTAYGNKTERKNARFLVEHYSDFSKVHPTRTVLSLMVEFIPEYNKTIKPDLKYGRILSPNELVRHIVPFMAYKRKFDLDVQFKKNLKEKEELEMQNYEQQKRIINEMDPEERERLRKERNEKMFGIIKGNDLTIKIK